MNGMEKVFEYKTIEQTSTVTYSMSLQNSFLYLRYGQMLAN